MLGPLNRTVGLGTARQTQMSVRFCSKSGSDAGNPSPGLRDSTIRAAGLIPKASAAGPARINTPVTTV